MKGGKVQIWTEVVIFVDGSCYPNPDGPGGWAAYLQVELSRPDTNGVTHRGKLISGGAYTTTNNKMELIAAIRGLDALTRPCKVTVYTDSKYVQQGASEWLPRWKRNGWKTRSGLVANQDLWKKLDTLLRTHRVSFRWIQGHAGNEFNELVDEAAKQERLKHTREVT